MAPPSSIHAHGPLQGGTLVAKGLVAGSRVGVLANASSGSGRTADFADEVLGLMAGRSLEHSGADCRTTPFVEQIAAFGEDPLDAIVAIGGDGTVNAAAEIAMAKNALLFIVPAGTMDLVAGDLGLRQDPLAAVAGDQIVERRIDCGVVNGKPFLHSSLIGVVPAMARARERLRAASDWEEKARAAWKWCRAAVSHPGQSMRISSGGQSSEVVTRSLAITVNRLESHTPFAFRRERLDGGVLAAYASKHRGPFASVRLLATLGTNLLDEDPEMVSVDRPEFVVTSRRRTLTGTIDGEVRRLETPVRYTIRPRALRVAVPADIAPPAAAMPAHADTEGGGPPR